MSRPSDEKLYERVKTEVDKSYDKPSAYRSMAYTRAYLKAYREKYGDDKKAYAGKKPGELKEWRDEKWIDVKSFVKDPVNPTKCGNAPIGKGEYPLCMPMKEAKSYSEGELKLLMARKNELGKRRLVKDTFLRDVLKPDEIPAERIYKQKYNRDRRLKLAKPLPEKKAEKIEKEPTMKEVVAQQIKEKAIKRSVGRPRKPQEEVVVSEPTGRPRGRPVFTEEQKVAAAERRKEYAESRRMEARAEYLKSEAATTGKKEVPIPRRFYTPQEKEYVSGLKAQEEAEIEARRAERQKKKEERENRPKNRRTIRSFQPLTISNEPVTLSFD